MKFAAKKKVVMPMLFAGITRFNWWWKPSKYRNRNIFAQSDWSKWARYKIIKSKKVSQLTHF